MTRAAAFLTPLRCEQVTEDDWILLAPLRYSSAVLDREIVVPEGFVTDFASVPRLPFIYWFTGGKAAAPATLHDWIYRDGAVDISRDQGDAVLAEAMEVRGYWRARTWMMWAGVRVGGAWSYKTRAPHEPRAQALFSRPIHAPSFWRRLAGRPGALYSPV